MELLCPVCDREFIENESEYKNFLTTLRKKMINVYIKTMSLKIIIWMRLIKY